MTSRFHRLRNRAICAAPLTLVAACATLQDANGAPAGAAVHVNAGTLPLLREMDERFQSFQIGMSHLTGGETWRTYDGDKGEGEAPQAQSFDAVREARAPTDLANRRLRNLTAALAPLYIRYGGTTSNSVYFQDSGAPPPAKPPEGFQTLLTRERWKAAIDFAKAVDAKIITGFTVSDGVRDKSGAWTPAHARPWLEYTRAIGGEISAAELYNEPNAREPGRTDEPESAENYARDFARLTAFRDSYAPSLKLAGPGTAMLGLPMPIPSLEGVTAEQYMKAQPTPRFDIVSYHFYGALAERCAPPDSPAGVSADDALTEAWLARPDKEFQKFRALRDQYAPNAPIWLTETGAAACGGTRWQPTFLETFRFLDAQARLAKQGLDVIVTHALISGSNGVIDEKTLMPNADYWAALLWRRLMGTRILDAGSTQPGLHVYAHCQRGVPGGVTLLAINLEDRQKRITVEGPVDLYALTAPELQSRTVLLNGKALQLDAGDTVPATPSARQASGKVTIAPTSITFVGLPQADNAACRVG
jgi:heparanase